MFKVKEWCVGVVIKKEIRKGVGEEERVLKNDFRRYDVFNYILVCFF